MRATIGRTSPAEITAVQIPASASDVPMLPADHA